MGEANNMIHKGIREETMKRFLDSPTKTHMGSYEEVIERCRRETRFYDTIVIRHVQDNVYKLELHNPKAFYERTWFAVVVWLLVGSALLAWFAASI